MDFSKKKLGDKDYGVVFGHGKYIRENFNVSELNNLDALLVEYDLKNDKHKVITYI